MDGAQFHPPWVGDAGGKLKRNYLPWMVQVVDSTRKTILGRISVRPCGTEVLCSTPTQDCAALVLSYFRFLPPGEWAPAVSSIGVGEAGGRLGRNKKRKFSKTKDEFSDPTHRTKRRPMDGAQFHPPWVGDAGGKLTSNKRVSC